MKRAMVFTLMMGLWLGWAVAQSPAKSVELTAQYRPKTDKAVTVQKATLQFLANNTIMLSLELQNVRKKTIKSGEVQLIFLDDEGNELSGIITIRIIEPIEKGGSFSFYNVWALNPDNYQRWLGSTSIQIIRVAVK
jgi:hypothetical protein